MASELAGDAHRVEIPYDDCAVDAARRKVVALAIEANTCRVARPDCICDVFWVVLQQVVVGQEQIHLGAWMRPNEGLQQCSMLEHRPSRVGRT